jgi:hypothetical protein
MDGLALLVIYGIAMVAEAIRKTNVQNVVQKTTTITNLINNEFILFNHGFP